MDESLKSIIENLIPQLQALWLPIVLFCILVGITFFISGFWILAKKRENLKFLAWLSIIVGVMLTNFPAFLDTLSHTLLMEPHVEFMSYTPPPTVGALYIQFALYVIQLIGVGGVVQGILLLRTTQHYGDPAMGKAAIHMIFGTLAANVVLGLRYLGSTTGGMIEETVSKIIGY